MLIAAVGLGVAGYLLLRGSPEPPPPSAPTPLATGVISAQPDGVAPGSAAAQPPLPDVTSRKDALDAMVRSAANRNLVATFEVRAAEPDQVVVVSALCADPRLQRLIDERLGELTTVGFDSLRCIGVDGDVDHDGDEAFHRALR
jgi:hypothetical protein